MTKIKGKTLCFNLLLPPHVNPPLIFEPDHFVKEFLSFSFKGINLLILLFKWRDFNFFINLTSFCMLSFSLTCF